MCTIDFCDQHKTHHPGKLVSSFAMGTKRLYDFVDDNPGVVFFDCSWCNDPGTIRQNKGAHGMSFRYEFIIFIFHGTSCSVSILSVKSNGLIMCIL